MNYKIWRKKWFQICLCKKYFINLKWDKKSYHKSILEKIFYWKTTGNPIKSWTKKDSHQKLKTTLLSRKWKSSLYCKFWSNFLIGVYKILTLSNQSLMKIFTVNTTGGGGGLGWEYYVDVELQTNLREVWICIIKLKAASRVFSWLNAATTACLFKILWRHFVK